MKISWLLFDADNTLLDFTSASRASLWQSFEDYNLECTPDIYSTYKSINASVWSEFEKGEITAVDLRRKRFHNLFESIGESNIDPSEFSIKYLENLVLKSETYDGVLELLETLKKSYRISLVTNGLKEVQRPRLTRLNLNQFFDSIIVSDEIGVAKPEEDFFNHTYQSIPDPPPKSEILIIGDNPISDIQGGQNFGINTCLVTHGNKNKYDAQPNLIIEKVGDLIRVL